MIAIDNDDAIPTPIPTNNTNSNNNEELENNNKVQYDFFSNIDYDDDNSLMEKYEDDDEFDEFLSLLSSGHKQQ